MARHLVLRPAEGEVDAPDDVKAEWTPLFDDPLPVQSTLDRLPHNAHQGAIEGESFRCRQRPAGENAQTRPQRRKRKRGN